MVTQQETPVEAAEDSPAEDVSPPVVEDSSGDELLIPDDTPSEDLAVPSEELEAPASETPEVSESEPEAEAEVDAEAEPSEEIGRAHV